MTLTTLTRLLTAISCCLLFTACNHIKPVETVMTEEELIRFLRIPEISNARNHRNVVENLKRTQGLPRIHLCGKAVYMTDAVKAWLDRQDNHCPQAPYPKDERSV